jgi:hypothetical protein
MILAMGHTIFEEKLRGQLPNFLIYPEFFDSKKDLLQGNYHNYIRKLWTLRKEIKVALYPDYVYTVLPLPKEIEYIIPVHEINERVVSLYNDLINKGYKIWLGYASTPKFRDYTILEFNEFSKKLNTKTWYLGISTWREFKEALQWNFDGIDITTMLLGKFEQIKNYDYVKRRITELLQLISKPGRQLTLYDFVKLGSLTGERR